MDVKTLVLGPINANCYVVTDEITDKVAVIDCGDCTEELIDAIGDGELEYIMLTHGHADHLLGVYDLKQRYPKAEIIIHSADADHLLDEKKSLAFDMMPSIQKYISADRLVEEGDVIVLGETEFYVMHTPGHTKGGVCYYVEKERTLFTGDTLFCLTVGRTDFFDGDDDDMYSSIERLYNMPGEYTIYPGHNRATTMEYERRRNRYMRRFK